MAGAFERNRVHLHNLARRKQMERETAAARDASRANEAAREKNFTVHFSGANRKPPQEQQPPPTRPDTGARVLRVAGALPVQTPLVQNFVQAESLPQIELAPRISGRPLTSAELPQRRRARRTWELGKAVLLKASGGELLQIDVPVPAEVPVQ